MEGWSTPASAEEIIRQQQQAWDTKMKVDAAADARAKSAGYSSMDAYQRAKFGAVSGANGYSGGGSGSNSSSGLFGSGFGVGDMNDLQDNALRRAKDYADFGVGIHDKTMGVDSKYRDFEANRDYGFQTGLENLRQGGEDRRLGMNIANQQKMQQSGFDNQTNQRAQSAALARLGFSGRA